MSTASALAGSFLDLIFPPRCFVCRTLSESPEGVGGLCDTCAEAITPVPKPLCDCCGQALRDGHSGCSHCRRRPAAFVRSRTLGAYEGVLRDTIHRFKYHDRSGLAAPLGQRLAVYARTQASQMNDLRFDAVLPIPMHPTRRRLRGYNQSERLARVVGHELDLPLDITSLRRTRATRPQVGLAAGLRQSNLHAAFQVNNPAAVTGHTLLLIDDVSTTGATLHECALALKAAGAKAVYCLTLAAG